MITSNLHTLLLLSDSALPLGSFAFSSGLESYLAHHKASSNPRSAKASSSADFDAFLSLSLSNLASTALPYVLTAHAHPSRLASLDNDLDASTACTVARRASVAQGRALITIWERSLHPLLPPSSSNPALTSLTTFVAALKSPSSGAVISPSSAPANAHFAPLFGIVCSLLSLSTADTAYLFLLNHAKALLSAAVRASVMGPYQAQAVLASASLQDRIRACVEKEQGREVEDAGITVPAMEIWAGRHELLYSRIFNS